MGEHETNSPPLAAVESNDKIEKLAEALAKAQAEIQPPIKKCKVDFQDKNGRRVKYNYADLADVLAAVREPLTKNGLAVTHQLRYFSQMFGLKTTLMHSSGQLISSWYPLPDPMKGEVRAQEFGSALTYARRYSLSALVGIASDEDDDGGSAPAISPPQPQSKPPQQKPKVTTVAEKKTPQNQAPADDHTISVMYDLARSREVKAEELNYLIQNGYGVAKGKPLPNWIAQECIRLLENEDCTATTVMAESQRVISRREAKRIVNENGGRA